MSLGSFLKKVNKVSSKVQNFSARLSTVDRSLKNIARAVGTTKNKSKTPAARKT